MMASPKSDSGTFKEVQKVTEVTKDVKMRTGDNKCDEPEDPVLSHANAAIDSYLVDKVPIYQKLKGLREKGWASSEGDRHFENQRRQADKNSESTVRKLNEMMKEIAKEMQCRTRAFTIQSTEQPQCVLDLCMAPGTYLLKALERNPDAHAVTFTLPQEQGGLALIESVSETETVKIHSIDITMLAADMDLTPDEIPDSHPDASNFIHDRYLDDGSNFDLVLCDGAVRRTHERAEYRSQIGSLHREPRRLLLTQLALGLEHLRPGGTMVVLLHKVEGLSTIRLLRHFTKLAHVVLFKPKSGHAKRSSFYMVASAIKSDGGEAVQAVREWKREWKVATLGSNEEFRADSSRMIEELGIERLLDEFGPTLVKLGQKVWKTQAEGLGEASFMKK